MENDLLAAYESAVADGGSDDVASLSRNANVHMGDDDVQVSDTDTDTEVDVEVDESDDSGIEAEQDINTDTESDDSVEDDATDDVFDFDSIKDKTVSVTVNGETFEVPLAELRNGYMRQSDYTRKTQQVSQDAQTLQWAREMQEAFRVDPAGSIRYLQEQFGLLQQDDPYADLDPELQPIVSELKRTQQELAQFKREREQSNLERVNVEVQAELESMQSKYSDFDPMEVLPIAIENSLSMEKAYKLWKADRLEADMAAQAAAKAKAEAAAAKREKARQASKKVTPGSSKVSGEADDSWKNFDSFSDIFAYEVSKTR